MRILSRHQTPSRPLESIEPKQIDFLKEARAMTRAVIALLVLGVIWYFIAKEIAMQPLAVTWHAMDVSFHRIHLYAKANNKLPATIAECRENRGFLHFDWTEDGWGNELIYEVSESGIVSLTSLGADNRPGGIGDDADITESYRTVDEDGRFIAGDDEWLRRDQLRRMNAVYHSTRFIHLWLSE
jgi:hypothetical protein